MSSNVTQADREAARSFVLAIFDKDNSADDTARRATEAFARHREQSTAALEAQLAEAKAENAALAERIERLLVTENDRWARGYNRAVRDCLAALKDHDHG